MDLLHGTIVPDQTIWIVCALFYVFDNLRSLGSRQLVLSERLNGQWTPLFPLHRYRLAGRALVVLNPLLPWLAAVQMDWLTEDAFGIQRLRRSKKLLGAYRRRLMEFRALSAGLIVALFIAGPLITHWFGLGLALICIFPFYLAALAVLVGKLIVERRFWRMSWSQLSSLIFQCAVCPGVFINICRRVSLGYARVPGDVLAYALVHGGRNLATKIERRLHLCLDDLNEHEELTLEDQPHIELYMCQLKRVIGRE
jgi:hypothetical protein